MNTNSSPEKSTFVPSTQPTMLHIGKWRIGVRVKKVNDYNQNEAEARTLAAQWPGKHLSIVMPSYTSDQLNQKFLGMGPKNQYF